MMTTTRRKRTDEHRPSVIETSEYSYVGVEHERNTGGLACIDFILAQRKIITDHMTRTGGTYARHEHGGNCHVCGAAAIYTVLFHHEKSNTYIRTGFDCAEKLDMGNAADFRAIKQAVKDAREAHAGKQKAKAILSDNGLDAAWALYDRQIDVLPYEERTIRDIVGKLVKYGNASERQLSFVRDLLAKIPNREKIAAQRATEKLNAADCVTGRQTIVGTVLKTETQDSAYGMTIKMLVKADAGFCVWGSVPSSLQLFESDEGLRWASFEDYYAALYGKKPENVATSDPVRQAYEAQKDSRDVIQRGLARGDRIELTATFTKSDKDSKFGFFKRPIGELVTG